MSLPKVMGTETEYGLYIPGRKGASWEIKNSNGGSSIWVSDIARDIVTSASDDLSASFQRDIPVDVLREVERRALEQEQRRIEARKARRHPRFYDDWYDDDDAWNDYAILPSRQVKGRTGHVLGNGARFYVDMGHPEYSTPECLSPRELVLGEKAGERIVELGRKKTAAERGETVLVHKNNSDGKGNSYSCHENYLLEPSAFHDIISGGAKSRILEAFFVTRQIFTGSGKVGCEAYREGVGVSFQISQRADFIGTRLSHDTSWKRAIINQRDRAYADRSRYRRLHVICGDSNMAELSIFLKVGTTAIVLRMLEDDFFKTRDTFLNHPLRRPVHAFRTVSSDIGLASTLLFQDGERRRAIAAQFEFLRLARLYFETKRPPTKDEEEVLSWWSFVLRNLLHSPEELDRYLDWRIKKRFLEGRIARWQTDWTDTRIRWIDIQYHNVNPDESWYHFLLRRGKVERLFRDAEVETAMENAPPHTRAWLRGALIKRFLVEIRDIGWDYVDGVDFSYGLHDPLKGTREDSGERLDNSRTALEFFQGSEFREVSY